MTILVTGGAGYIGSHTLVRLLEAGQSVVVYDNLINSSETSLKRVEAITRKSFDFINADIRDKAALAQVFKDYQIDSVIHFAALKAVGESVTSPLQYYETNVYGSICLLEAMMEASVKDLIYSSSATVYGESNPIPYIETMALGSPSSPYGASKVMVERILEDKTKANPDFRAVSLRYFNPIGAHTSGTMGEDPEGLPNNLLPFVTQVAAGHLEHLKIFGGDYPTEDGTCIRDYLHVMDLADGHLAAQSESDFRGLEAFNLGAGKGYSVLDIVHGFEEMTNQKVPYSITSRRIGDLPAFWADATKARSTLKWEARRSLKDMLIDAYRWQLQNPHGYK
jgi:UDP-glucose 4-epimerase